MNVSHERKQLNRNDDGYVSNDDNMCESGPERGFGVYHQGLRRSLLSDEFRIVVDGRHVVYGLS